MKFKELLLARQATHRKKPVEASLSEATARDPKKIGVKSMVQTVGGGGRGGFEESPIDLDQVSRAYHTDAYIRRAIDKIVNATMKQGWDLKSKNEKASEYIWTRMKLMEEATKQSWDTLHEEWMHNLVLYSNNGVVKARAKAKSAVPGLNATGYTSKQPIAGYFTIDPISFQVERDEFGNIQGYQQAGSGGQGVAFKAEDIVHFTHKKPTGRAYGVPYISRVLDDVRMLRLIEDNVSRLIHRELFPLHIYQVGLNTPGFEATDTEIDEVRASLQEMPLDGTIVLPERHNIKTVGAENNALDASNYLKYFRQRVFSGLDMSDSTMGVGDTANKSTSDNMSADLTDLAKEFQKVYAAHFQKEIINELLFEGGFDPTLNPDDEVIFFFNEIEEDAKRKRENHIVQLYLSNIIDQDETRRELGYDPLTSTEKLSGAIIASLSASTNSDAAQASQDGSAAQTASREKPENQSGKQDSPGKAKRETKVKDSLEKSVLTEQGQLVTLLTVPQEARPDTALAGIWSTLKQDVIARLERKEDLAMIRGLTTNLLADSFERATQQIIDHEWQAHYKEGSQHDFARKQFVLSELQARSRKVGRRLVKDVEDLLEQDMTVDEADKIFYAKERRVALIGQMEASRARELARALSLFEQGATTLTLETNEQACDQCKRMEQIDLTTEDWMTRIPPHHVGCTCSVQTP